MRQVSAVMLDGGIFDYTNTLQCVAQRCTWSPNRFDIYIYVNDLIVAVEAAKAGRHGRGRSGVGIDVCR